MTGSLRRGFFTPTLPSPVKGEGIIRLNKITSTMFKHLPNILTVLRMILVPVFLTLVIKDHYYAAGAVFAIAGISDSVDGFIAKRYKLQTEFGALLDPIADKLLLSTAYVVLAFKDIIPIWLAVPVVLRDLLMLSIALILRLIGKKFEPKPTPFGKVSTILQVITVVYALGVYKILGGGLLISLVALTTIFTIYSAIDYAITGIRMQSKTGK